MAPTLERLQSVEQEREITQAGVERVENEG
jgi:hypothetical protein